jgi:UDP-N-acetyl-D-mannosaminuronate dehydrogenase
VRCGNAFIACIGLAYVVGLPLVMEFGKRRPMYDLIERKIERQRLSVRYAYYREPRSTPVFREIWGEIGFLC